MYTLLFRSKHAYSIYIYIQFYRPNWDKTKKKNNNNK